MFQKYNKLIGQEDAYVNLQPKRVLKGLAGGALIATIGSNIVLNGLACGETIYDGYLRPKTADEKYLAERISKLGINVRFNCLPLYELHGNHRGDQIVNEGNVTSFVVIGGLNIVHKKKLHIINMTDENCHQATISLRGEAQNDYSTMAQSSEPIGKVMHEYEHLSNENGDEATTECHNTQRLKSRLETLGYPPYAAREINVMYAASTFRLKSYLSSECRPGGALDLQISSHYPANPDTNPYTVKAYSRYR